MSDGQDDELVGDEAEAEKQWEGDKSRETHHLTEDCQLALTLIAQSYKHRLIHLFQHIPHQKETLGTPLVGLIVMACVGLAIVAA